MNVMTVLGPISPDQLGFTSAHEHLLIDLYWKTGDIKGLLDNEGLAVEEITYFKNAGGKSIVELTNIGLRRNPAGLKRIAEKTGLNIIMGSGWYRQPFYPHEIERRTTNDLAAEIVHDLTVGVGDTGIKAGVIGEIGVDVDYITPAEERVARAAARASRQTGAAIITHSVCYPIGLAQMDIFEEEGADLRKVIIGHADTYTDIDYHEAIAKRGSCVLFDGVGSPWLNPDKNLVTMLVEIIRRGYIDHILLGTDRCFRTDMHSYGGTGYDHLINIFLPLLKEAGISDEQIQIMTIENPKRVLPF